MQNNEPNIFGLFENLKRAVEIAMLGNYSIACFYDEQEYENAPKDYKAIMDFYKPLFNNFTDNLELADIKIELHRPSDYNTKRNGTGYISLDNLKYKINTLNRTGSHPKINTTVSNSHFAFFSSAIKRLNLSLYEQERVKHISNTIARLQQTEIVLIEHLAEAIQYSNIDENLKLLNLPPKNTFNSRFIDIQVKDGFSKNEIFNAIEFLQKISKKLT